VKTDRQLLRAYLAGSEDSFGEIARRYAPAVLGRCRRALGDAHEAEDACQAVFLVLARKAHSIRRGEALAAWLLRTASYVSRTAIRARARRRRFEEEAAAMRRESSAPGSGWREVAPEIDRALDALPAREREAVALHYLAGRTQAEVARELRCPEKTAHWRIRRGLARLREKLARRGVTLAVAALGPMLASSARVEAPGALLASLTSLGKFGAVGAGGAAGATAAASGTAASILAKGAIKMMFWMKVKVAAAALAAVSVVGGGSALAVRAAPGASPAASDGYIKAKVVAVEGAKITISAGAERGVRAGFEFEISREENGKEIATVKVTDIAPAQSVGEAIRLVENVRVGDFARTKLTKIEAGPSTDTQLEIDGKRGALAWGKAVNDLQIGLVPLGGKPWGATFAEDEPIRLVYHLRNVGEEKLTLISYDPPCWRAVFVPKGGGVPRVARRDPKAPPLPPRARPPLAMEAGSQRAFVMEFDRNYQFEDARQRARESYAPIKTLPPGKYTVTASYEHAMHDMDRPCPYWHGKVATGAVEIEVKPKGAAEAPVAGGEAVNGLRLVLEMSKPRYAVNEHWDGVLRVELVEGMAIFDKVAGFRVHLERTNGEASGVLRSQGGFLPSRNFGGRLNKDAAGFVRLAKDANEVIEIKPFLKKGVVTVGISGHYTEWKPPAGIYRIWFTYRNDKDGYDVKGKVWTGELKSNVVTVIVGQPAPAVGEAVKGLTLSIAFPQPGGVCSGACAFKFQLANGVHKCATCEELCNLAHKYCPACAKRLDACQVCGKKMKAIPENPAFAWGTARTPGAPIPLVVTLKNVTEDAIHVWARNCSWGRQRITMIFTDVGTGRQYRATEGARAWGRNIPTAQRLGSQAVFFDDAKLETGGERRPPGTYRVRAVYANDDDGSKFDFVKPRIWTGTVTSNELRLTIDGAGGVDAAAARRIILKWVKDNGREKTWGEPVTEKKMRVDDHGKTWQVIIRFDRGGVFGIGVEKATGRILVPVD